MNEKGFSLVKIMVVIAIVALLAAVAIPSYRQYHNRSKTMEAMAVIRKQLDTWVEQHFSGSSTPQTLTSPSPYVTSIVLNTSDVIATLAAKGLSYLTSDLTVTYTPTTENNVTTWVCTYAATTDYSKYIKDCQCQGCPA